MSAVKGSAQTSRPAPAHFEYCAENTVLSSHDKVHPNTVLPHVRTACVRCRVRGRPPRSGHSLNPGAYRYFWQSLRQAVHAEIFWKYHRSGKMKIPGSYLYTGCSMESG